MVEVRTCSCGSYIYKNPAAGPWPPRCESCQLSHRYGKDVLCAGDCGKMLWGGSTSLPAGKRMCLSCRRERNSVKPVLRERACNICGARFIPTSGRNIARCTEHRGTRRRDTGECEICGSIYSITYADQRTCGRACGVILRRTVTGTLAEVYPFSNVKILDCLECGEVFVSHGTGRRICSRLCVNDRNRRISLEFMNANYERFKPRLLEASHRRRAKHLDQFVENVNHQKVFERDKWRCGICGEKVDRSGKRGPRMPSLDHIVPISQGGEHSYANTQCAHYRCNLSKNDGFVDGGEQLALA